MEISLHQLNVKYMLSERKGIRVTFKFIMRTKRLEQIFRDVTPHQGERMLKLYSIGIGSEGLWPQLICCAPFPSTVLYFRVVYVAYLKIQMTIVLYLKAWTSIVLLSEIYLDIRREYIG
jgi:hypothetical protein